MRATNKMIAKTYAEFLKRIAEENAQRRIYYYVRKERRELQAVKAARKQERKDFHATMARYYHRRANEARRRASKHGA